MKSLFRDLLCQWKLSGMLLFLVSFNPAFSQPSPGNYYREFIVKAPAVNAQSRADLDIALENHPAIAVDLACEQGYIIFKVNASYPKRIPAIEQEILLLTKSALKTDDVMLKDHLTRQKVKTICGL